MSGNQKMEKKLSSKNPSKDAMIKAKKVLPDLDVYCYDSKGDFQGIISFINYDAETVKKFKLSNKVKSSFKDCKEETKLDAWLGRKPGAGKEIKFEGKGLTGKSSIFKLYCAAFGGASKLEKLLNEQEKNVNEITICIQVVE